MKNIKTLFIVLLTTFFMAISCKAPTVSKSESYDDGKIGITVRLPAAAGRAVFTSDDAASYKIEMSLNETVVQTKTGLPGQTVTLKVEAEGLYTVTVTAYDATEREIAKGSATADLKFGDGIVPLQIKIRGYKKEIEIVPEIIWEDEEELDIETKYDFADYSINQNWHIRVFNEYPKAITINSSTENSISFTVNYDVNPLDLERMIQIIYGNELYEKDSKYVCSYKLKGPAENQMNVCLWVTECQGNLISDYCSESFAQHSFNSKCNTTGLGGLLFFPTLPGEYMISDVEISKVADKKIIVVPSVEGNGLDITLYQFDEEHDDIRFYIRTDDEEYHCYMNDDIVYPITINYPFTEDGREYIISYYAQTDGKKENRDVYSEEVKCIANGGVGNLTPDFNGNEYEISCIHDDDNKITANINYKGQNSNLIPDVVNSLIDCSYYVLEIAKGTNDWGPLTVWIDSYWFDIQTALDDGIEVYTDRIEPGDTYFVQAYKVFQPSDSEKYPFIIRTTGMQSDNCIW